MNKADEHVLWGGTLLLPTSSEFISDLALGSGISTSIALKILFFVTLLGKLSKLSLKMAANVESL